jgi:hypothetical protein
LYSTANEVSQSAVEALKKRRHEDYTNMLLEGLHYPWPAVAERAVKAITELKRTDLVPQLVAFLDEADPRLPVLKVVNNEKVPVVRELVRINHHRNCLLCHAPANGKLSADVVTAPVAILGQSIGSFEGYYKKTPTPDILVRADVTYLRQDFSMLLLEFNSSAWAFWQRFDFVVRNRVLTGADEKEFREKLESKDRSPYHVAALTALRQLTGRNAEPTASAWKKELRLSE